MFHYVFHIAIRPYRTTKRLISDPSRFRVGLTAWFLISIIYCVAVFIGGFNGYEPVVKPFLPIDSVRQTS